MYLTGALSVLLGIIIAMNPAIGGLSVVYTIAGWAIAVGLLKIVFAFRVRSLSERIGERLQGATG